MAFKKRPAADQAFVGIADSDIRRQAQELLDSFKVSAVAAQTKTREPEPTRRAGRDRPVYAQVPPGQRRVVGACGICGQPGDDRHLKTRRSVPGLWFGLPQAKGEGDAVTFEFCNFCLSAWEQSEGVFYEGPPYIPAPVGYAVTERLRNSRSKHRRPDLVEELGPNESIAPEHLATYTYAGRVIAARIAGQPDPQPPKEPFDWLK